MAEELADGWGASTPPDDTLVRSGVESLLDRMRHMARAIDRPMLEDGSWAGVSLGEGMFFTSLLVTRPVAQWDAAVAAARSLTAPGTPCLLISPFPTPDLRPQGMQLVGHPPFMARPAGAGGVPPVPGLEIRVVAGDDELEQFERTLVEGYPIPGMQWGSAPRLYPTSYLEGSSTAYLGLLDGRPVAAGTAHVAAGVNHVEAIVVRPEHRGHGIGKALSWAATVTAPELPAVLLCSDDGRRVYQSLGYLPLVRWTMWIGT